MAPPLTPPDPNGGIPTAADFGIVDSLVQLSFLIQGTLAKYAAVNELSLIQTRLLGVLRDRVPTMQELARLLTLDKSSVTGLVDRAELRGLVRRLPAIEDRRATRVELTRAGRELVDSVATAFADDLAIATACLTRDEQHELSRLATRIIATHWVSIEPPT